MSERRMLKYPLFDMGNVVLDDSVTIKGPWPTSFQHLAMQGRVITLWAIAGDMLPTKDRTFLVVGTGHVIQGDLGYVGTVQDGMYVWHVFEKFPPT